jgi:hypothetical protein
MSQAMHADPHDRSAPATLPADAVATLTHMDHLGARLKEIRKHAGL